MNDTLHAAKLRAILLAIRSDLKPELTSPVAKLRADLIDMLLSRLVVEAEGGDPGEGFWQALETRDPQALSDLLANGESPDVVAAVAAAERDRRVGYEAQVAEALAAAPTVVGSSGELDIPAETFTAYLRKRFPDDAGIHATKVVTVPGGRSKGTILVDLDGAEGPRQIVVRKDFGHSVTGTSVANEYPIVRAVFDAGLPVPEPYWLEEDPAPIGGKFIAFQRLPGKAMGTLFTSDASPAFALDFAGVLGRLHSLDLKALNIDGLRWADAGDPVAAMIESFYERYRTRMRPVPLMDAAFAYLRGQLGQLGGPTVLVHGDAGVHNTLGEKDRVTALLDWEFTHAGDAAEDLTYCKFLIERIVPWDEFMAAYRAAGGAEISDQRTRFFTIWRTLHLAVLTGGARELFDQGGDQDLRIAAIGYNTFPKQLRDLAADLAAATA